MTTVRRERITISDIAAQLGISKASVSYALNGRPGVSAETRARVLHLADELGFHASSAAVALSASRTGTIGIVIARDPAVIAAEAFYMRTLFGVEQYLNDADGQLLLRLTGERGKTSTSTVGGPGRAGSTASCSTTSTTTTPASRCSGRCASRP